MRESDKEKMDELHKKVNLNLQFLQNNKNLSNERFANIIEENQEMLKEVSKLVNRNGK